MRPRCWRGSHAPASCGVASGDAVADGEVALEAAIAAGDRSAEAEVLNTLGMAQIALGEVDEGVALLRRAIEIARENDDDDSLSTAYSNLADMLELAGPDRTRRSPIAKEGLAADPTRATRSYDWMELTRRADGAPGRRLAARARVAVAVAVARRASCSCSASCARPNWRSAQATRTQADANLRAVAPLAGVAAEPQWIGLFGSLPVELALRRATSTVPARRSRMRSTGSSCAPTT